MGGTEPVLSSCVRLAQWLFEDELASKLMIDFSFVPLPNFVL